MCGDWINNKVRVKMSSIKGIKVGSTNITSSYTEEVNKTDVKLIEITSVRLGFIETPNDTTYTGFAQEPSPVVEAIVGGVRTVLVRDTDYTLTYSNNTDAGVATVTATGKGNFVGTVSSTWTIGNATIDVEYTDQSYVYNGSKQGVGITASVIGTDVDIKYGLSSGTYNLTEAPQFKNVSDSADVFYRASAPNHTTVTGKYHIDITKKTATLTWGTLEWVYDGEPHSTTCVVGNLVSGDVCTVNLSGNTITAIGNTIVKVESLSNNNYSLPSSGLSKSIVIKPGLFIKVSGSWVPVKAVYEKINGSWVKKTIGDNTFDIDVLYMNRN